MAKGCLCMAVSVVLLALAPLAGGEELIISNCDGSPRLVSKVEESAVSRVEVAATLEGGTAANGIDFTLSSENTATRFASEAVAGKVTFESVPPGRWSLCSEDDEVSIDEVKVVRQLETGSSVAARSIPALG